MKNRESPMKKRQSPMKKRETPMKNRESSMKKREAKGCARNRHCQRSTDMERWQCISVEGERPPLVANPNAASWLSLTIGCSPRIVDRR